jgi:putative salt-induced outer membrane protein
MKLFRPAGAVILIAAAAAASLSAQEAAKKEKTTSFTGDVGFVNTAGNTRVTTLNVGDKFVANTPDKKIIFTQLLAAVYGETDGEKSAENYLGQLRLDYGLGDRFYLFGLTGWDRNTFGGISRRFEETIGLAYKALARPKDELGFEVGLSLFQQRNTVADDLGSFDDNYKAGRLAGLYKHTFQKTSFLSQAIEFLPNFDVSSDWRLNSETAFVAPISTNVALKVGYIVRYDNLPSFLPDPNPTRERFKKTDRFLTTGITISY